MITPSTIALAARRSTSRRPSRPSSRTPTAYTSTTDPATGVTTRRRTSSRTATSKLLSYYR